MALNNSMALTDHDLSRIQEAVKIVIKFETKDIRERIKILPTRKEFLHIMSRLMGEVKNERDENTILDGRTSEQEIRIARLEKMHPHGQHSTT